MGDPSDAEILASYRAGCKSRAPRPWHLLDPEREDGRSLCWASCDPATVQRGVAPELACKSCLVQARRLARRMPDAEFAALQDNDWVLHRKTRVAHRVTFEKFHGVPQPVLRCYPYAVLNRDRFRRVPEPEEVRQCMICLGASTGGGREPLVVPEPLAKLGEVVAIGTITGLYGRPIKGGHELKVKGAWVRALIHPKTGEVTIR